MHIVSVKPTINEEWSQRTDKRYSSAQLRLHCGPKTLENTSQDKHTEFRAQRNREKSTVIKTETQTADLTFSEGHATASF